MKRYIPYLLAVVIILLVFHAWFVPGLLTSGDFWFSFESMYPNRPLSLYAWDSGYLNGMGGFIGSLLWIYLNFGISYTFGAFLGLPWSTVERIFYLYPFLILCTVSSYWFFTFFFPYKKYAIVSSLLFSLNTYVLMMVGGGQVAGVGMAYALSPFVLGLFIKLLATNKQTPKNAPLLLRYSLLFTVAISVQLFYDIRIGYVVLFACLLYFFVSLVSALSKRYIFSTIFYAGILPSLLTGLIHAFWLVPTMFNFQTAFSDLGRTYTSTDAVKFLSFAKFEQTISLLHPYWPENIFGKVSFMDPTFLILPIVAFSSLLFITRKEKNASVILFFVLLGVVGAFLGKGANDPFGQVYLWLFDTIPGFVMFRDSTKWYTLVALSYAVLIPFSICRIYQIIKTKKQKLQRLTVLANLPKKFFFHAFLTFENLWVVLIISILLLLIKPAFIGELQGMFHKTTLPSEYVLQETFLKQQAAFFRTLWIPSTYRFGYNAPNHPAVSAVDFLTQYDSSQLLKAFSHPNTEKLLQNAGIKYVILPYDSQKELFITDRKFDEKKYLEYQNTLDQIPWLTLRKTFGYIRIYEVAQPKEHIYVENSQSLVYRYVNPTRYEVNLSGVKKGDRVVFLETFDPNWIFYVGNYQLPSEKYQNRYNSFIVPDNAEYTATLFYTPQLWVERGIMISVVSSSIVFVSLILLSLRRKHGL